MLCTQTVFGLLFTPAGGGHVLRGEEQTEEPLNLNVVFRWSLTWGPPHYARYMPESVRAEAATEGPL
jgi:hypothetical protein